MKKFLKIALVVLLVLLVLTAIIMGIGINKFKNTYISFEEAREIALADAQLDRSQIIDIDTDFEKSPYSAWYEVDYETHGMEYDYSLDAVTGEILHSSAKPDR